MSFKILKDIVLVNIKKNWVMILSFFVFLVISLSMFFGMTSYIIGFRSEMPSQAFATQKYSTKYDTWDIGNHAGLEIGNSDWETPIVVTDGVISKMVNTVKTFGIDSNWKPTDDQIKAFCVGLSNYQGGVLPSFEHSSNISDFEKYEKTKSAAINDKDFRDWFNKLEDKLEDASGLLNLTSYVIGKDYLDVDSRYKGKMTYGFSSSAQTELSPTYIQDVHISAKKDKDIKPKLDSGIYSNPESRNKDNVVFVSPNVEKNQHYKIGQAVSIQLNDYMSHKTFTDSFTYGGTVVYPMDSMVKVSNPNNYFYFVNNYNPDGRKIDLTKELTKMSQVHYEFRDPNSHLSSSDQIKYWYDQALASGWLSSKAGMNNWGTNKNLYLLNIIYTAMYSLTIALDVIMMVLDIVIAWFLIKEIIRSLSKEILFLKTLGMTNTEASLITSFSLLIILGVALGLSLVGLLGIQALFISLTNNFVVISTKWSSIQPYSLIAIFGAIIFLLVVYYVLSVFLIRNMKVNSNDTTPKSEYRFAWFRSFLFKRNINSGITFSFSVKNLNRIITTFVITLLISCLSFIALGFKDSVTRGKDAISSFNLHKDNASHINGDQYRLKGEGKEQRIEKLIDYKPEALQDKDKLVLDKDDPLSQLMDGSDVTGKCVYSDDLYDWLSEINDIIGDTNKDFNKSFNAFKEAREQYINKVSSMWPKASTNFVIDFGNLYYSNNPGEAAFQFNNYTPDGYRVMRMVVLNPSDKRYSKLFNNQNTFNATALDGWDNEQKKNVTIPSIDGVVSSKFLDNTSTSVGSYSTILNERTIQNTEGKLILPDIDFGYPTCWPDNNRVAVHYIKSSDSIIDENEVYVKQSDFESWLNWMLNEDSNEPDPNTTTMQSKYLINELISEFKNNSIDNTFLNNYLPLSLQQFVVPKASDNAKGISINVPGIGIPVPVINKGWNENKTLFQYLFNATDAMNNASYTIYSSEMRGFAEILDPLITTMIVVLVLALALVLTFTVFIIMTILNENDGIIFIMKALGYSRNEILWRMISGYLISVVISIVIGTVIASVVLNSISPLFHKIIFMKVGVYAGGPILGLFFALIVAMFAIIVGISANGISKRNLTVREE